MHYFNNRLFPKSQIFLDSAVFHKNVFSHTHQKSLLLLECNRMYLVDNQGLSLKNY